MKKTRLEAMREEIELARQGKIKYEADPPYVIIRDPENLEKRLNALRRLNGLPEVKTSEKKTVFVKVGLSKTAHARVVKLARKRRLPVEKLLTRIVEAAC